MKARERWFTFAGFPVLLAGSVLLASCSWFGSKEEVPPYYSAAETAPLKIPEGLDRPTSPAALVIAVPESPLPQREMPNVPPRVATQSSGGKNVIPIKWSAGGIYLVVQDTPESTFRRLGLVIERSGMSRSEAISDSAYRFEYHHDTKDPDEGFFSKLAFWRDDAPNYSGEYEAVVQADGQSSRVYIKNGDGTESDPEAAEHLLAILGERLG